MYWITLMVLVPIAIIALVFFLFFKRRGSHTVTEENWYLSVALSKEDAISQLFLLLSFFFLGVTLLTLNRDFGDLVSWRTILFLTSVIGLAGSYYFKSVYTLAFSLIGLVNWWGVQAIVWIQELYIRGTSLVTGLFFIALLLYAIGFLHEQKRKFKRFSTLYLIFGLISVIGTLFILSTKPGLFLLESLSEGSSIFVAWQMLVSLLLFFVAVIFTAGFGSYKKLILPHELLEIGFLASFFSIIFLMPQHGLFVNIGDQLLSTAGVLWAIVFNMVLFFLLLGVIFSGYQRQETWLINLGTFFIFLLIVVKYFDWFFTFLDKSIFFISAGVLLFIVGWMMEKARKKMISNLKSSDA